MEEFCPLKFIGERSFVPLLNSLVCTLVLIATSTSFKETKLPPLLILREILPLPLEPSRSPPRTRSAKESFL